MLDDDAIGRLKAALSDRYAIEREIGSGGMATVYLAHDPKHGRKVAVKVFHPELAAALGTDRFFREITITANLSHPHILPLLESGEADGFLYYVMPVVEGDSLRDRMNREKQLAVDDAVKITEHVASALSYAHTQNVVHRDIKPENILLQAGEVVVADFGIALAVDSAGGTRLTETGFSLGTPAYMSPEQVSGEQEIDGRSDIYSLACVLYEMLAGDPPFVASSPRAVLAKHMTDPAPPITTVRSSVPQPVAVAITKALGKAPADRFDSVNAFSEALFTTDVQAEEQKKSIVVLPFEDLSPDSDQEYFSDGLTEEVIADLSKVRSLRVISRSSAMTFKGSEKRMPEIAGELNVRYALEGSVRKAGNSLRITAQLIDAADDAHLWADKYTGTLDDVFDMQEQVSRSIVEALQLTLTQSEHKKMTERPIEDASVLDYYLRARHEANSFTKAGIERALGYFQSGLELVGDNALLYAGIAYTYFQAANAGLGQEQEVDRAEEYAKKALELDPDCPDAHLTLGLVYNAFRGDQRRACDHIRLSLETRPDDAHTLCWLIVVCYAVGKMDAALPLMNKAMELDPLDPLVRWLPVVLDHGTGRFDEAADFVWHQLPPLPHFDFFHATSLTHARRFDEARALIVERVSDESDDGFAQMCRLIKAAIDNEPEQALSLLTHDETRRTLRRDPIWSYYAASFSALGGLSDTALDWLENAIERGFINYPMIAEHDPFLTTLRGQSRYDELLERVRREWEVFEI
jgi:serine/threonine protein kinase